MGVRASKPSNKEVGLVKKINLGGGLVNCRCFKGQPRKGSPIRSISQVKCSVRVERIVAELDSSGRQKVQLNRALHKN